MDLRTERTRRSIINAFIELRAKKPLEKITIKELSEHALINKATFYSHYRDIYDLSEQLEKEAVDAVLKNIPHPENMITDPSQATAELAFALMSQSKLFDTLFSGSRAPFLINRLEQGLKDKIYAMYPEYKNNLEWDIMLSVLIQGCFHAFAAHMNDVDIDKLVEIIGKINECILAVKQETDTFSEAAGGKMFQKAIVIGSPGAGKSTFSRKLRDVTGLPLYYLDMLWHKPDKTTISRQEFDAELTDILTRDKWIIDGNYNRTLEMRLKYCDAVFLMDFPLDICLLGAESRVGKEREDMPWYETELDSEFKQLIIDFPNESLPQIYELIEKYREDKQVVIFKTREESEEYLKGMSSASV